MKPIRTLFEREPAGAETVLPEDLRAVYGGDLRFLLDGGGRPYIVGNFVSTLDGVVSYETPGKAGGGDISGFDEGDRFIMGLLRASADAVLIGAGTLDEVVRGHVWAAEFVNRAASESYAHYREQILHKPKFPLNVVVSGSGRVDLERAIFRRSDVRTVIITTPDGLERLVSVGASALPSTEVRAIQVQGSRLSAADIVDLLWREFDVRLLLHEGGPMLFGTFIAQKLVDEFFLTIAPQLAGRSVAKPRPGMVSGVEFSPDTAPWLEILSAKQSGDHLYLRYQRRA
jgi:riboflavin biosynthesis pyrimidine reductase